MTATGSPAPRASRPIIALVLAAHLIAGMALGVAFDRFLLHPHPGFGFGRGGPRPGEMAREQLQQHIADRLTRDLDLTADQRVSVESVLARQLRAFDSLRSDMEPRLRQMMDSSDAQIRAILSPEQQRQWERNRRRFEPGKGPPPPRP